MPSVYPEIDRIGNLEIIDGGYIDSDEMYEFIIEKVDENHVHQFTSIQHAFEFLTNDIARLNAVVTEPVQMEYYNPPLSNDSGSYYGFVEEENNNYNNNNQLVHRSRPDYDDESEYIDVVGLPGKENLTVSDTYHMHPDSTFQKRANYKTQSNLDWDHMYSSRQHSNECPPAQMMSQKLPVHDNPDSSKTKRRKSTSKQTNKKTATKNIEPVCYVCFYCGQKYRRKLSFDKHEANHKNGNHPKRSRSTKKENILNVIIMDHS